MYYYSFMLYSTYLKLHYELKDLKDIYVIFCLLLLFKTRVHNIHLYMHSTYECTMIAYVIRIILILVV